MDRMRARRWVAGAAAAAGAVLLLSGCGGKEVTFSPASAGVQADGRPGTTAAASPSGAASSAAAQSPAPVATPSNLVITTQGSTVCVRNKDTGSQACVGTHGTAVVNGVVIVDGKVVSTAGSDGSSIVVNGGSVVNGGNVVTGGSPPVPTSGQVTLSGAVQWRGAVSGTCQRSGEVRHAVVNLPNSGRLGIDAVGTGVVRISLVSGGDSYAGNWVGDSGIVSLADKSLTVNGARVGRGSNTVQVTASLNC
jgi:hypothetical protein